MSLYFSNFSNLIVTLNIPSQKQIWREKPFTTNYKQKYKTMVSLIIGSSRSEVYLCGPSSSVKQLFRDWLKVGLTLFLVEYSSQVQMSFFS